MREDYGKTWFNILDYTGSATRNFADPDFDGYPEIEEEVLIDRTAQGSVCYAGPGIQMAPVKTYQEFRAAGESSDD